jgi:hypothetical protein
MKKRESQPVPGQDPRSWNRTIVRWAVLWYIAAMTIGGLFGAYYFWPGWFLMWLRLDEWHSWLPSIVSLVLGAGGAASVAYAVARLRVARRARGVSAALLGLVCMLAAILLLSFAAWNVAEFFDWPTMP